jgi:1-acyl-sn-glycerol-3-phosphate acyltransferase
MSLGGIKESLRRLRAGDKLVVFPEGTRSEDGTVGPLKPGFLALVRRGRVPILPAAVDGAYDAWPRSRKLPRPTRLCTVFGPIITVEEIVQMSDEQLMEQVRDRIVECHRQAHALRQA